MSSKAKRWQPCDHTAGAYCDPHEYDTCPDCHRLNPGAEGLFVTAEDYAATLAVLRALCNSLRVEHGRSDGREMIDYTTCPVCGVMDLYQHVPDLSRHHKPDCALIKAREAAFR